MWLRCCGAVCVRVGDACGWWRARSAVPFPVTSDVWYVAPVCSCFLGGRVLVVGGSVEVQWVFGGFLCVGRW